MQFDKRLERLTVGPTSLVQQVVTELLGEEALLFKEKINFKLPGGGGFVPHQDQQAGWSAYHDFFISVMIGIDEATIANGCLYIAGQKNVHEPEDEDEHCAEARSMKGDPWMPVSQTELQGLHFVPITTQPGDVVFFTSYAVHRSEPNNTTGARRCLYLTYNAQSAGDMRQQYYADKRKSYPPDCERIAG